MGLLIYAQRLVHVAERISELRSCPAGQNGDARAAVANRTNPALKYVLCYSQFVCPAMNQGTFKYNQLSVEQEVSSLKLIHHNFK